MSKSDEDDKTAKLRSELCKDIADRRKVLVVGGGGAIITSAIAARLLKMHPEADVLTIANNRHRDSYDTANLKSPFASAKFPVERQYLTKKRKGRS